MLKDEQRGNRNDDKEKFEKWRNWKGQSWEMSRKRMKAVKGEQSEITEWDWMKPRKMTELVLLRWVGPSNCIHSLPHTHMHTHTVFQEIPHE